MSNELPEGWALFTLSDVCCINPPKPPADALPPDAPVTFVPMPAVDAEQGAITDPSSRVFAQVRKGFTAFRNEDVILAKITPCMENGKAAIARGLLNGYGFGSTEFHVLRPSIAVLAEYVYYFIRQESFREKAAAEMTGSVGQKRVPTEFLKQVILPLPPLTEQKRIVAKVEELLARVNAARERLGRVPAMLKRFRQSVLAAACLGRLTEDWRELTPCSTSPQAGSEKDAFELPDDWRWVRFGDLLTAIRSGSTAVPHNEPTSYPILRSSSVRPGFIDLEDVRYLTAEQSVNHENYVSEGDLFFTRLSGSLDFVGNCARIPPLNGRRIQYPDRLFCGKLVEPSQGEYFVLVFNAPFIRDAVIATAKSSAGHQRISIGNITNQLVPVPPSAEMMEIVRRVDALFKLADAIEKRVAAATQRAEKLTQAILAKAFRGELVPTEAELARAEGRDYEPASALLERIRAERTTAAPPTRQPRRIKSSK